MKIVLKPPRFDETPELGQGFHFAEPVDSNNHECFIVLNHEIALTAKEIRNRDEILIGLPKSQITDGASPSQVELSGESILRKAAGQDTIDLKPCESRQKLIQFLKVADLETSHWFRKPIKGPVHESPPLTGVTTAPDQFYRFSIFRKDRRITEKMGVLKGTYVTSESDFLSVPNALAATGRYALPSPIPPVHVFRITPRPGTALNYGTVVPAFGQAGGGAEMEFKTALPSGSAVYRGRIPEW